MYSSARREAALEAGIERLHARAHLQGDRVEAYQRDVLELPHARERHVAHAAVEGAAEVDHGGVEGHPLALVYRDRPRELERQLRDGRAHFAALLDLPLEATGRDALFVECHDDGIRLGGSARQRFVAISPHSRTRSLRPACRSHIPRPYYFS